ncbi:uncharacterized protein BDR25DRAFT_34953 [Lindgomyces ingoldianus]|uniref:Uncharacterized protein n=1 Tax=Lindgomyces ingoldianus TaxID=673940 RepID=A0ACB6QU82_9PLEO|nr:uncharacterized protein BDR25DRAFT_34953 [Lindgomyces ingoldianus]KAF2470445.1 hypothetical protein BDR25DRAFT_34953 [Lindgomyces ingoldianus]
MPPCHRLIVPWSNANSRSKRVQPSSRAPMRDKAGETRFIGPCPAFCFSHDRSTDTPKSVSQVSLDRARERSIHVTWFLIDTTAEFRSFTLCIILSSAIVPAARSECQSLSTRMLTRTLMS